jgi:hypothetical protein
VTSFFSASSSLSFSLILFCRLHNSSSGCTERQPAQQLQSRGEQVGAAAALATYLANSKASPPSPAFPALFIPLGPLCVQL